MSRATRGLIKSLIHLKKEWARLRKLVSHGDMAKG